MELFAGDMSISLAEMEVSCTLIPIPTVELEVFRWIVSNGDA